MKFSYLKRLLLLLHLVFCSAALAACSCEMEEWNMTTFERYDFIAHVRVLGVGEVNGPFARTTFSNEPAVLRIEVLELYRGEKTAVVYNPDANSSCGTFVQPGEEWILFTYKGRTGNLMLHACTPSTEYRALNGQKLLSWSYPNEIKHWVDTTCQVTLPGITYSGVETYRAYYANDQLEEQTEFLDGKKHGRSVHYYPDGTLMDEREYYHGTPIKLRRYYEQDGSPNFELEYDSKGELVRETNYLKGYDDLLHEILYEPKADLEKDYAYREDGSLAVMTIRQNWSTREEKYYDVGSRLIHHVVYDKEGEATNIIDSLEVVHLRQTAPRSFK